MELDEELFDQKNTIDINSQENNDLTNESAVEIVDFNSVERTTNSIISQLSKELGPDANIEEKIGLLQSVGDEVSEALTEAMANGDLNTIKDILTKNDDRFNSELLNTEPEVAEDNDFELSQEQTTDNFSEYFNPEIAEFKMMDRDPNNSFNTADLISGDRSFFNTYPKDGKYFTVDNKILFNGENARDKCILAAQKFAIQETESWIKDNLFRGTTKEQQNCFWDMLTQKIKEDPEYTNNLKDALQKIGAERCSGMSNALKEHIYIDFDIYEKKTNNEVQYLIHGCTNIGDMAQDFMDTLKDRNLLTPVVEKNLKVNINLFQF